MKRYLFKKINYLLWLAIACALGLHIYLLAGTIKVWAIISWIDVFGEGSTTLLYLFWLVVVVKTRPAGLVTHLLALGLAFFVFSAWMDFLDEFIKLPKTFGWNHWFESLPAGIGILFSSLGLYHWHKEELAIRSQITKRERVFRDHRLFDSLIPLNGPAYLREQIKLAKASKDNQPLALIALEVNGFNTLSRQLGIAEANNVLQFITQLLLLNLRDQDLICRLAGERFMILLTNTSEATATQIADELKVATKSLAYKTTNDNERIYLSASCVTLTTSENENVESLLHRINMHLNALRYPLKTV